MLYMAFEINSGNRKQNLTLSVETYSLLLSDETAFTNPSETPKRLGSNYINRVILSFYKDADSTIGIKFDRECKIGYDLLNSVSVHISPKVFDEMKKNIKKQCFSRLKNELLINTEKRHNVRTLIRINNKVYDALCTEHYIGDTAKFYTTPKNRSPGKYLTCLLEEYAKLPRSQRELYFFNELAKNIFGAIEKRKAIKYLYKGDDYVLYPIALCSDEWNTYNYVVGITEGKGVINMRLCYIEKIEILPYSTFDINQFDIKSAIEQITKKGVMFVSSDIIKSKIRLTSAGLVMYNNMSFLRPLYKDCVTEIDENGVVTYLCSFECTELQILFYFFKYGIDAEIIEPENLRDKFKEKYKKALEIYEKGI